MRLKTILLVFSLSLCLHPLTAKEINVRFYSESIDISYSQDLETNFSPIADQLSIINYYRLLERKDFQLLLDNLAAHRSRLELNDWLYYELLYLAVDQILKKASPIKKELTCWFLLSKEDFDTRIAYVKNQVFLYVYTKDALYEVPMIKEGQKTFVNLTSIYKKRVNTNELNLLNFSDGFGTRAFGFYLEQFPNLKPVKKNRQIKFYYDKVTYTMKVKIDHTIIAIMERYPMIEEQRYMEVPLSSTIENSLLPKLEHMIKGKTPEEAIKLLVAFTRSSFEYKEDEVQFGMDKPMIADEVFYYPFSDCEDRSALFYVLVKELLDLPMVIIAFEGHLTIGVAIPQFKGDSIRFKGTDYYICDPTGPIHTDIVGVFPSEYVDKPFEIIGYY